MASAVALFEALHEMAQLQNPLRWSQCLPFSTGFGPPSRPECYPHPTPAFLTPWVPVLPLRQVACHRTSMSSWGACWLSGQPFYGLGCAPRPAQPLPKPPEAPASRSPASPRETGNCFHKNLAVQGMAFHLPSLWHLKWLRITYMNLFIYWQK